MPTRYHCRAPTSPTSRQRSVLCSQLANARQPRLYSTRGRKHAWHEGLLVTKPVHAAKAPQVFAGTIARGPASPKRGPIGIAFNALTMATEKPTKHHQKPTAKIQQATPRTVHVRPATADTPVTGRRPTPWWSCRGCRRCPNNRSCAPTLAAHSRRVGVAGA